MTRKTRQTKTEQSTINEQNNAPHITETGEVPSLEHLLNDMQAAITQAPLSTATTTVWTATAPVCSDPAVAVVRAPDLFESSVNEPLGASTPLDRSFSQPQNDWQAGIAHAICQITNLLAEQKKPKVAPPRAFDRHKGDDFAEFLEKVQSYGQIVYPQDEEHWITLLEDGLKHPDNKALLDLCRLTQKSHRDFSRLSKTLLKYYETYEVEKPEDTVVMFDKLQMATDESVTVFSVRLLQLARKVFPGVRVKTLAMIRYKFIACLPLVIQKRVRNQVENIEAIGARTVEWEELVKIAAKLMGSYTPDPTQVLNVHPARKQKRGQKSRSSSGSENTGSPPRKKFIPKKSYNTYVNKEYRNSDRNRKYKPSTYYESSSESDRGYSRGNFRNRNYRNGNRQAQSVPQQRDAKRPQDNFHGKMRPFPQKKPFQIPLSQRYSALQQQNSPKKYRAHSHAEKSLCAHCGKPSHNLENCWLLSTCKSCGKIGHTSRVCKAPARPKCPYCKGAHWGKDCRKSPHATRVQSASGHSRKDKNSSRKVNKKNPEPSSNNDNLPVPTDDISNKKSTRVYTVDRNNVLSTNVQVHTPCVAQDTCTEGGSQTDESGN